MQKRDAADIFSEWASNNKDEGMQRGHAASVEAMLSLVEPYLKPKYSAIDVGCGNGWVCRKLLLDAKCNHVVGIDGAETMILKAKSNHHSGEYYHALLPEWLPKQKFDLIHSMEFLYYLKDPLEMLKIFYNDWLNIEGVFIGGIDYYTENYNSHDWPEKLNVHMTKLSIEQWKNGMINAGFKDIEIHQVATNEDFIGTLVMIGKK